MAASRDYIRWYQQALNELTGAGLAVDGELGPRTRAAVRDFQERVGLTADGMVGPRTEAALISAGASAPPADTDTAASASVSAQLPTPGDGYWSYKPSSQQHGLPETIQALQAIGVAWQQAHPDGPRIGIGDISNRGGGDMRGHASHERGVDVDIRPVRGDGREDGVTYHDEGYSRDLTQELVDLIRANGVLRVEFIFFNDPDISGVKEWPNHDNHLHVRFFASSTDTAGGG